MNPLEAILTRIRGHHINNPDHGVDCACMDRYIRELRAITDVKYWAFAGDDLPGIQQRVDYVIRKTIENRS